MRSIFPTRWATRHIAIDELDGGAQVQQIAHTLGYATPSAFIVMFKRMTGTTPEQYRLSRTT